MGFSTLLDILGSTLVGGLLLLILFRMTSASAENTYNNNGELIVQQNLTASVELLEYDFRKIGYCKNYNRILPGTSILSASDTSISFLTDFAAPPQNPEGDGIVDTLHYYLGRANELSELPNQAVRLLYRVENRNSPRGSNLGITMFHLTYYGSLGDLLTSPVPKDSLGTIATIRIDLEVQDPYGYDTTYSSAFWRQIKLVTKNLNRR